MKWKVHSYKQWCLEKKWSWSICPLSCWEWKLSRLILSKSSPTCSTFYSTRCKVGRDRNSQQLQLISTTLKCSTSQEISIWQVCSTKFVPKQLRKKRNYSVLMLTLVICMFSQSRAFGRPQRENLKSLTHCQTTINQRKDKAALASLKKHLCECRNYQWTT